MTTENRAMKALHELDFNIMRDGDGEIQFKMNQHTLDCFWRSHLEIVRTTLLQSAKVNVLLDALKFYANENVYIDALGIYGTSHSGMDKGHQSRLALSQFHATEGK